MKTHPLHFSLNRVIPQDIDGTMQGGVCFMSFLQQKCLVTLKTQQYIAGIMSPAPAGNGCDTDILDMLVRRPVLNFFYKQGASRACPKISLTQLFPAEGV